jgi:hypothetical protein
MVDIKKLVNALQSAKADTRYDACEELRVAAGLPQAALVALETATRDPDPAVADAATRVLRVHAAPSPLEEAEGPSTSHIQSSPAQIQGNARAPIVVGASSTVAVTFILPLVFAVLNPLCPDPGMSPSEWLRLYAHIVTGGPCLPALLLPLVAAALGGLSGRRTPAILVGVLLASAVSLLAAANAWVVSCFVQNHPDQFFRLLSFTGI